MKSVVKVTPIEVQTSLDELGITREELLEVVYTSVGARRDCTSNHPPSAPGSMSWFEGTKRLRELLAPKGWEPCNDGHISSAYARHRKIKIVFCNADDGTGVVDSLPQNWNRKGAATSGAVSDNQAWLNFGADAENVIRMSQVDGIRTYFLFVYCEAEAVRAELSLPSRIDKGFFQDFEERIILLGRDEGDGPVRAKGTGPDEGLDFDISVIRKGA
jgi:hypothetical protein